MSEHCFKCGIQTEKEICDCGSEDFIFGANLIFKDGQAKCECGSDKFNMGMHMDGPKFFQTNYSCDKCGSAIGVKIKRNEESLMYWDSGNEVQNEK